MDNELEATADLIKSMINDHNKDYLTEKQIDRFGRCLKRVLKLQWKHTWNPNQPKSGNGFRSLWVYPEEGMNQYLHETCKACQIYSSNLKLALPLDFTIWVNPGQVRYCLGDKNNVVTVYQK